MDTKVELIIGKELNSNSLEACLSQLFCGLPRDNIGRRRSKTKFDLSDVRFIQIDTLLFLLCIMSYLKTQGVHLELVLPEKDRRWCYPKGSEWERVTMVRDFLVRWKLQEALREAVGSINEVLPPHQESYFDDKLTFYKEKVGQDELGEDVHYLSSLLIEITHMTRGDVGNKRVSEDQIVKFLRKFSIQPRLKTAIDRAVGRIDDDYFAKEFSRTLLWETLINTEEHPNATMSMIAMARDIVNNELVISVADNGETIPQTILPFFTKSSKASEGILAVQVSGVDEKIAKGIHGKAKVLQAVSKYRHMVEATVYATKWGTTSKPERPRRIYDNEVSEEHPTTDDANLFVRGLGLYYVKERTLEFGGTLTIRTNCLMVRFAKQDDTEVVTSRLLSPWPGNLIRIGLPMIE